MKSLNKAKKELSRSIRWWRMAVSAASLSVLAACGGGGGAEAITPAVSQPIASGELSSTAIPVGVVAAKSVTPVYDADEVLASLNISDSTLVSQVKPGVILVMPATQGVPEGVALKVKTVTPTTGGVNITFTQPGINEVFKNLEIRLRKNISAEDITSASLPAGVKMITQAYPKKQTGIKWLPGGSDGIELAYEPKIGTPKIVNAGEWTDLVTGEEFQRTGNFQLGNKIGFKFEKFVLVDQDGKALVNDGKQGRDFNTGEFISPEKATVNDQLRLNGELAIKNSAVDFDIKIEDHDVMRMGARMNGTVDTKLTFGYQYAGSVSLTDLEKVGKLKNEYKFRDGFEIEGIDFGDERIFLGSIGVALYGLVPGVAKATGNSIPKVPLGAVLSLSVGLKGDIVADASLGFNYTAYFDQGLYIGRKKSSDSLGVLNKMNVFAHGDYPNPNVSGARPATQEDKDKKPFFSFGLDGKASVTNTTQIGIDLSIVVGGMIPVQISLPFVAEEKMQVKGSAWRREAGWDITGCYQISSKIDVKSNFYARIQGKIDSDWDRLDTNIDLVDKKIEIASVELMSEKGVKLTCSVALNPTIDFELNPKDISAPSSGKTVVRFSGDAKWEALLSGSKSGAAEIDKWEWKFGESALKDSANAFNRKDDQYPIYTYDRPGSYDVELKVTDRYGQEESITKTVVIKVGAINANPTTPTALENVLLWISDAYSTVKTVVWNFGTGIAEKTAAVSAKVTQVFSTAGPKVVTATLKDATNRVLGTTSTTITVSAAPMPTATIVTATSDTTTQPGLIANNGTTDDTTPTLKGTLSAALTDTQHINIYDSRVQYWAHAVVSGTNWTFTPATPLIGGTHSFTAEVADAHGMADALSAAYVVNVLSTSVTSVTPAEIIRTLSGNFDIVGRDLPTSGLSVKVPGDAKASCQAPTSMTTSSFKIACKFYQLGAQTLEIRTAAKLISTVSVLVKTNVTGVTWTSPSTTNSGTVKFREKVTYKVAGVNLLADPIMGFAVEKCGGFANPETGTPTNTLRTFNCYFNDESGAVAGQMPGVVKDAPGGQVLFTGWNVPVEAPAASSTGKLPDTGVTTAQCYAAGSDALVSCTSAAAIALNSKQDGMIGRDVSSSSGSDGKLGFSYSAVGSYTKEECVKDNITGLTWEGKPISGPRAASAQYTNYGDSRPGDASAYVAAVNAAKLCGYSDWRLPTKDELQSIVDYGVAYPTPTIDGIWFPNTQQNQYWTGTGYAGGFSGAWSVHFLYSDVESFSLDLNFRVRLVR